MISKQLDAFLKDQGFESGSLHSRGRNFLTSESIRGQWNEAWRKYFLSQGYSGSLQGMTKAWEAAPAEPGEDTTAPEIIEATLSEISAGEATLVVVSSEVATATLNCTSTNVAPSPAFSDAGKDSTGATSEGSVSFAIAAGVNSDITATLTTPTDPGDYYLWLTLRDAAGNISAVWDLGGYTIEASSFTRLIADQEANLHRDGAINASSACQQGLIAFQAYASSNAAVLKPIFGFVTSTSGSFSVNTKLSNGELRIGFGSASFRYVSAFPNSGTTPSLVLISVDTTKATLAEGVKVYSDGVKLAPSLDAWVQGATIAPNLAASEVDMPRTFPGGIDFVWGDLYDSSAALPDLDDAAVRAKFAATEINLTDGSGVTGSSPLAFKTGDRDDWNTATNLGTLTGFVLEGDFNAP